MEEFLKHWLKRLKLHESTISMLLGALVVFAVAVLVFNYFSGVWETSEEPAETPEEYALELVEEEGKIVPRDLPTEHEVTEGEDLWSISEKYFGNGYNWPDIASANSLADPDLVFVSQRLTIPRAELRMSTQVSGEEVVSARFQTIEDSNYVVSQGDTLWSIAVRAYQDGYRWPDIFAVNRTIVSDPNLIEVGMVISLPR